MEMNNNGKEEVLRWMSDGLHEKSNDKVIDLFVKLTRKAEQMERERMKKLNAVGGDPRLGEHDDVDIKGTPEFEDIVKKDWGFDWWRKARFAGDQHVVVRREIQRTD